MQLKVCGILLDISKAFGKVWHDGLIFKLRQSSICGEMINILENLVNDRKQNVVLNGNCSSLILALVYHIDPLLDLCYF